MSYGDGTVSIGGAPLRIMYIDDDGKAWARKNDVETLAQRYVESLGVQSPSEVYENFAGEYAERIRNELDSIRNRKEFSYNPNEDPVYIAYREKYLTEGDRATRDTIANYAGLTGGYVNSAAVTAGAHTSRYWTQQLANALPTLAQQAYQRYYDRYMTDLDIADRMADLYDKEYTNAYKANNKTADNANYSSRAVVLRDEDEYAKSFEREKFEYDKSNTAFEQGWADILNRQEYETGELENYMNRILNEQLVREKELSNSEKSIFIEYYRRLLESELEGEEKEREKTDAEIAKLYAGF